MYGDSENDMCRTLSQMHRAAVEKCNFDQVAAREFLRSYVQTDRRFDQYDAARLVQRVEEAMSNGRTMDLTEDPWLRHGGEKRPLSW